MGVGDSRVPQHCLILLLALLQVCNELSLELSEESLHSLDLSHEALVGCLHVDCGLSELQRDSIEMATHRGHVGVGCGLHPIDLVLLLRQSNAQLLPDGLGGLQILTDVGDLLLILGNQGFHFQGDRVQFGVQGCYF